MIRDQVDLVSGDWNQGGGYSGECVKHAVWIHERNNPGMRVKWIIQGHTEIRIVFFHWQGLMVNRSQCPSKRKETSRTSVSVSAAFGIPTPTRMLHSFSFYEKHPYWRYQGGHTHSQAGIEKEAKRRKLKRQRQRQQAVAEARAAQPGAYSKARGPPQTTTGTRWSTPAPLSSTPMARSSWQ